MNYPNKLTRVYSRASYPEESQASPQVYLLVPALSRAFNATFPAKRRRGGVLLMERCS